MPWNALFDTPFSTASGTSLRTLQDARDYILSLSQDERETVISRVALELLNHAARDGGPWLELATVAMHRVLGSPILEEPRRSKFYA
jgi:hypothetical protein